jgi:hypothetical protein
MQFHFQRSRHLSGNERGRAGVADFAHTRAA